MDAGHGKEERDDGNAFANNGGQKKKSVEYHEYAIEEQPLSAKDTKAKENETKSNQSQNKSEPLPTPFNTEDELSGGLDEKEPSDDGLEIIELDAAVVEAEEDSNAEKEHRGVAAKEVEFNGGVGAKVELELNGVGENSRVADLVAGSEDTVEEENVEEETEEKDDILSPALSLLIFKISMPCLDLYFDTYLIRNLFANNRWGCLFVLVSALATNFLFTSFAWWRIEPKSQKTWSWIFLIFQIWPQLKAVQVSIIQINFS